MLNGFEQEYLNKIDRVMSRVHMFRKEDNALVHQAMNVLMYPYMFSSDTVGALSAVSNAILLAKLEKMWKMTQQDSVNLREYITTKYVWITCVDHLSNMLGNLNFSENWGIHHHRFVLLSVYHGAAASRVLINRAWLQSVTTAMEWQRSQVGSTRCRICGLLKTLHGHCYLCTQADFVPFPSVAKKSSKKLTPDAVSQSLVESVAEMRRSFYSNTPSPLSTDTLLDELDEETF